MNINKKWVSCLIWFLCLLSSLGTTVYAYRFPIALKPMSDFFYMFVGGTMALGSMFSNTVLGKYSISQIKPSLHLRFFLILGLACFASFPNAVIYYTGFRDILPAFLNQIFAGVVFVINTAIGFAAVSNFLESFNKQEDKPQKFPVAHSATNAVGFLAGLLVSTTVYLAIIQGIRPFFNDWWPQSLGNTELSLYVIGFVIWIPSGCLFSHSTKEVATLVAKGLEHKRFGEIMSYAKKNWMLLALAILSGSSLAEITRTFYSQLDDLPAILRSAWFQSHVVLWLVALSYVSNACVSYFAIVKLYGGKKSEEKQKMV